MAGKTQFQFRQEIWKVVCMLAIAAIGYFIPAPHPMTEIGMRVIFAFIAIIVGWSLTREVWPSFIGMLLFPLSGVVTFKEFIAMGWGTDIFLFLIMAFALIAFLEETGFSRFLTAWLMSRSFLQGHPWRLIFMILFSALVVCSMVNTFIGMFLMWEIVYQITRIIDGKPYDKFPTIMILGIAMMGATSLITMPWRTNAIINLGIYNNIVGEPADLLHYVSFTVPYAIGTIFIYMIIAKFIFRLDVAPLKFVGQEVINQADLKVDFRKRMAIASLIGLTILLLLPSLLPQDNIIAVFMSRFGMAGTIVFLFTIISFVTNKNEHIFHFPQLATKGINWNMLMMVLVILAVGGCVMHENTGIEMYLNQAVVPILTNLPKLSFIIVLIVFMILLTNFLINIVVVAMVLPLIIPLAPKFGLDPELLSFVVMAASTIAILTPTACAAASILFPNSKWITPRQIYKYGIPTVISYAIFLLLFYFVCLQF